jgi:hypothetical protein
MQLMSSKEFYLAADIYADLWENGQGELAGIPTPQADAIVAFFARREAKFKDALAECVRLTEQRDELERDSQRMSEAHRDIKDSLRAEVAWYRTTLEEGTRQGATEEVRAWCRVQLALADRPLILREQFARSAAGEDT